MILNYVKHEVRTNTAEVSWVEIENDTEGNPVSVKQVRCQNYSKDQAAEFSADVPNAAGYMAAMGW